MLFRWICDRLSELNKSGLSYVKDDGGFMQTLWVCWYILDNVSVGYYKEHF